MVAALSPLLAEQLIGEDELRARVQQLGEQIAADYQQQGSESLLFVGLLKGSVFFVADLMRAIPPTMPVGFDFMAISKYSPQAGSVCILKDLDTLITGRDVLLVKDIVDTGLSISYVLRTLRARQPRSLRLCVLLDRRSVRLLDVPMHYVGFTIPDRYVVGYGMDAHERFRNLPYIGMLPTDMGQPASLRLGD